MKRITTLLLIFVSFFGYSQIGRLPYQTLLQSYRGDTSKTIIGDSVKFETNLPAFNFNKPLFVNGSSVGGSVWTLSGSDIYYNTGNVGINNSSPSYKLDVNGLIGGSNIETNTTTLSVKLGINAGLNEDETGGRNNVFIGYGSGESNTTGSYNVFNGHNSGRSNTTGSVNVFNGASSGESNTTGSANVFNGASSGKSNTTGIVNVFNGASSGESNTTGSYNVFNGASSGESNTTGSFNVFNGTNSGISNTTGSYNVFNGHNSGRSNTTGSCNVIVGYSARYYGNSSNELVIDNQKRGASIVDSLMYRGTSLIYGKFDADTMNQYVDVNGMVYHTAILAEIYKTGTTVAQSIPTGTTPTKVTAFTTNKYGIHCTADAANDKITITKAGYYDFKLGLSYQIATAGVTFTAHIFVNGVEDVSLRSTDKPATANDPRSTAVVGIIHVTSVPCDVDYRVTHDNGGSIAISFDYCNMAVNYIGE